MAYFDSDIRKTGSTIHDIFELLTIWKHEVGARKGRKNGTNAQVQLSSTVTHIVELLQHCIWSKFIRIMGHVKHKTILLKNL